MTFPFSTVFNGTHYYITHVITKKDQFPYAEIHIGYHKKGIIQIGKSKAKFILGTKSQVFPLEDLEGDKGQLKLLYTLNELL